MPKAAPAMAITSSAAAINITAGVFHVIQPSKARLPPGIAFTARLVALRLHGPSLSLSWSSFAVSMMLIYPPPACILFMQNCRSTEIPQQKRIY
jgi:hypothetical protein